MLRSLILVGLLASSAAAETKPNIVFILADDLGYGDLGSYGQKLIRTPRLDKLAAEGIRFTQHYSGAPSCAPSRCTLMTGLHTGHARIRANSKRAIHPEDTTIAEVLKKAGYATGAFGKWGLGLEDSTGAPWKKGFGTFFGYVDQTHAHGYYPTFLWNNDTKRELPENRDKKRGTYSHDLIADEALKFVRTHKDGPFFLYVPFTIPHAEVTVPEDSLKEYKGKWPEPKSFAGSATYCPQDQPRAVRAAMISRLDRDVGRILDLLDELKLANNTIVMFSSDNGPTNAGGQDAAFFNSAGPLRGLKFSLYEGGIRVPFIARWPGRIAPGATSDFPSAFWDMPPTFAEIADAPKLLDIDGVSILPSLIGQPKMQTPRDYLYWESAPAQALRVGGWKAIRLQQAMPLDLYDLVKDIGEKENVAAKNPEVVTRIEKLMAAAHVDSPDFPLVVAKKAKK